MKNWYCLTVALLGILTLNSVIAAQQPARIPAENLDQKIFTSWPALSQKMVLAKDKLAKNSMTLTLQLDNLQDGDVVNIAPTLWNNKDTQQANSNASLADTTVDFSATTYTVTGDPEKKSFVDLVSFGTAPVETDLAVGHNSINFTRAESLSGKLMINVQVPAQTTVKLIVNNQTMVNSPISQPLAWRNGSIGKGEINRFAALVKTVKPNIRELPPGTAKVKFDQLKVRQQTALPLAEGVLVLVRLSINPAGKVTEAKLLYGEASAEVINNLYRWEFEPHLVNGNAVPVETSAAFRY